MAALAGNASIAGLGSIDRQKNFKIFAKLAARLFFALGMISP